MGDTNFGNNTLYHSLDNTFDLLVQILAGPTNSSGAIEIIHVYTVHTLETFNNDWEH